jgi:hypothetical protein
MSSSFVGVMVARWKMAIAGSAYGTLRDGWVVVPLLVVTR